MSDQTEKVIFIKDRQKGLDGLRAYHLGWTYKRFKKRKDELKVQIPLMEKMLYAKPTATA